MMPKHCVLTCCALLLAMPVRAQTGGADPISGSWTGEMARRGDTRRQMINLELRLDGRSVTGTVTGPPSPGRIRTGTFDPATGALRFEVTVDDGGSSLFVFEGIVVTGTALGNVTANNQTGEFKIAKAGAAPPQAAGETAAALQGAFAEVSALVTRAAELVPADRYSYRPTPEVRTFGELVAHVADAHLFYCARAAGREVQWSDAIEKGSTDKATVARELGRSLEPCRAAHGGGGNPGALIANIGHTTLHYGNMVTYLRLLGLTPPSS